ncbi:MAG TPA: peptidylprolyl isomerase [Thermodesulfovibrionales bacterium]|jgi:peptidyl-prolyl cis-trans isomerase C|nr:peptidylprolyl isomerase [Thermodesulfovibrionales bacterium]
MNRVIGATVVLFVMLCAQAFASDDTVLAKVGDKTITMADFMRIVGYYDEDKQKLLEHQPSYKIVILKRIVQGMVIAQIAKEKGFDKRPDVKEQVELLVNDFISSDFLKKEILEKITVTEDDMQLYYKTHKEEFTTPAMVRARHILIHVDKSASNDMKEKAKAKAEDILRKIKTGEDFAKLAAEFSDDPGSKTNGGDLGFFPKGKMMPDFEKVAYSLKPGEVSDVFETPLGYHIARVEEKKESVIEPYDKVRDKVKDKLLADFRKARAEEFLDKAMKENNVELNLEPLLQKK